MWSEKTKQFWKVAEALMLSVTIIILIFFIYTAKTEGVRCMSNPLTYGAKLLSDQNIPAEFSCSCFFSNEPNFQITFNKTTWKIDPIKTYGGLYQSPKFNVSSFNLTD